jgi:hypothetical protein
MNLLALDEGYLHSGAIKGSAVVLIVLAMGFFFIKIWIPNQVRL